MVQSLLAGREITRPRPAGGHGATPGLLEAVQQMFADPQLAAAVAQVAADREAIAEQREELAEERESLAEETRATREETARLQNAAIAAAAQLAEASRVIAEKDGGAIARAAEAEARCMVAENALTQMQTRYEQECQRCARLQEQLTAQSRACAELEGKLAAALAPMRAGAPPQPKGWKMAVSRTDGNGFATEYSLKPEV